MSFDLVITGGTLISAADTVQADLGIVNGRIAAVGLGLEGEQRLDATGKYVLPGAVDPHVHLAMPAGVTRSSDDWESGTRAAAFGGTTTVIDFVEPELEGDLLEGLEARQDEARGRAVIDYALHMTLRSGSAHTLDQVPRAIACGCTSFKVYTTYAGFRLDDDELLAAFEAVSQVNGLVLVHAENDAAIRRRQQHYLARGQTGPRFHAQARPVAAEGEAVERALALAEVAGCTVYIVHTSTDRGAQAVARARARGQHAYGETCPQYLLLTAAEYDRPGFEGAKFVCSPPLRTAEHPPVLWQHLAAGQLQTVGTDHCPFFYTGQKDLGRDVFTDIPNGLPGIEARLALLYTYGVGQGRLSLNRWVEVCCTAPAKIFNLYPRKGSLQPGSDADIVIFDPDLEIELSHDRLHEQVDYTPYEGFRLRGFPATTLSRGEVVCSGGQWRGAAGRGRFLARSVAAPAADQRALAL